MMSFDDEDLETTLIVIKQCFVYKIPPRASASGHRAAEWDLQNPIWTGRCVVTAEGELCRIKLEDPSTGEAFATCPATSSSVEPVNDSSRYYVIKIEDGSGRHAFIGLGFTDRTEAFDFSSSLQDHAKFLKQKKESAENAKKAASQPRADYSIPQGAKIHVELKNTKPVGSVTGASPSLLGGSGGGFSGGLLPPPPGSKIKSNSVATSSNSPLFSPNKPNHPQQQISFDDFFGASSQPQPQFTNQQQQYMQPSHQQNQFYQQQQQQQFQNQNQFGQFSQFQSASSQSNSNDWGDFTGSSNSQPQPQQSNANNNFFF